jgi:hypothetical protein
MELLYQYLPRSGYNLSKTVDSEIILPVDYPTATKSTFKPAKRSDSSTASPFNHFQIPHDIIASCRVNP